MPFVAPALITNIHIINTLTFQQNMGVLVTAYFYFRHIEKKSAVAYKHYRSVCTPSHNVPHPHDLPEWSCVNREVKTFNRKLVKLMKPYQHVTVMRVDPDRKFFTQHGLHMNNSGKERLASEIANLSANILLKHEVISLGWKNEQEDGINDGANEDSSSLREELKVTLLVTTNVEASTDELVQSGPIHMGRRISKRQKKPPVIKSDDFLW